MKLFENKYDKYDQWWNNLPKHTQEYLKSQPIWHDSDLYKAMFIAFALGLLLGAVVF